MKAPLHFVSQRVMGFSLVELMVAMTLGLLLMFGVVQVFDSTRQANRTNARTMQAELLPPLLATARHISTLLAGG